MSIELTEQQERALALEHEEPLRIINPRTKATYVLVPVEDYDSIRAILEDEKRLKAIAAVGLRNAVGRLNEEI